jgi:hypothetical protein
LHLDVTLAFLRSQGFGSLLILHLQLRFALIPDVRRAFHHLSGAHGGFQRPFLFEILERRRLPAHLPAYNPVWFNLELGLLREPAPVK